MFLTLGKFQKVGEQTIKQVQNIFKRFLFAFGELGGGGKHLAGFFAGDGLAEQGQNSAAQARGFFQIERERHSGAAAGKLREKFAVGGFRAGALLQESFHLLFANGGEMELQAARADGGQQRIRSGREKDQGGGVRRLFQDFQEDVGVSPAHGVRAVENKDAAAALGLEISGALHGAQLAHTNHGTRDGSAQAHGVGNDEPNIGIGFDEQGHALDHGGVGALAAFGETQVNERRGIGKARDFFAGFAFAAEVVFEALAIGGLGEHPRERVFSDSARAGEEQSAGNAFAAQHAANRGDDAFVAEKFAEAHIICWPAEWE